MTEAAPDATGEEPEAHSNPSRSPGSADAGGTVDGVLEDVLDHVLQGVPLDAENRRTVEGRLEMVIAQTRSPIPPPFVLREYEDILPGSADRLMTAAEEQSRHRQQLEKTVIGGDNRRAYIGQGMAFVVAVLFLVAAWHLISHGHPTAGTILGTVDIVGLVSVFILGQTRQAEGASRQRSQTDGE